jgi:TolB-like protein/Flp pilus assembly protein TadD
VLFNPDSQGHGHSPEAEAVSPSAVRAQLEMILASQAFVHSPQLCRLLRFVVDREMGGQGGELKEYLVGVEVFHRDESFDPRLDTVVRTEARRLRHKLAEYYRTEGQTGIAEIAMPKGSYRPVFRMLPQTPPDVSERAVSRIPRRLPAIGAFLAVASVGVYLLANWTQEPNPESTRPPSIAVLPLDNLSADPEQEYFSDGMTDALITDPAKIRGLRVVSRTSVLQYKRVKKPLPEIARQLGVDYVVEGTVLRAGERVRVTAQLIASRDERHLWANSYERDRGDVLALQGELARSIASEIKVHVTPQEQVRLASHPVSRDAHDSYLKGRFYWHRRDSGRLQESLEYFNQAIANESGYALAYAGLCDSYLVLAGRAAGAPRKDLLERARAAAKKALELDDTLGEVHTCLGSLSAFDWDWPEAERQFKKALELSPGYATAHQWYAEVLIGTGRFEEGLSEARQALDLDPLSPGINTLLGWSLYCARQYDLAIRQLRQTIEVYPSLPGAHLDLGMTYVAKGMHSEAMKVLEEAVNLTHREPGALSLLGHAYAAAGDNREPHRLLEELKKRPEVTPVAFALLYMDVGDKDRAFEWLAKGYEDRSQFMEELKVNPLFDGLRSDARFAALLSKMHLAN